LTIEKTNKLSTWQQSNAMLQALPWTGEKPHPSNMSYLLHWLLHYAQFAIGITGQALHGRGLHKSSKARVPIAEFPLEIVKAMEVSRDETHQCDHSHYLKGCQVALRMN
jgi:hypothetical protein